MTLDEIFPDGCGDGRKFQLKNPVYRLIFEPVFKAKTRSFPRGDVWVGRDENGIVYSVDGDETDYLNDWVEWSEPKKTKKVTMYKPVFKNMTGYDSASDPTWYDRKEEFFPQRKVHGWMSIEVEVDDAD